MTIKTMTLADLPASLPVFPLSGALLLPRGELPLNIFEPRYLAMVDYALGRPDRLIGMIQPRSDDAGPHDLYDVGCVGRINSFHETNDQRYMITLTGITRFRVVRELPQRDGFRMVEPDFTSYHEHDQKACCSSVLDRTRLMGLLKEYFHAEGLSCNWDNVKNASDDTLITALTMVCPFEAPEKQALLEAPDTASRGTIFLAMLEMAVMEAQAGDDTSSQCH